MKSREYVKGDSEGNYLRVYRVNEGWEIEINCKGKTLKYGASSCNRVFWNSRKQAIEAVNGILYKGINETYSEEHKRQFGF